MTINNEISKVFSKQAHSYEKAALVQQEIGDRLFERLHYLKIQPKKILDLGCGPGVFTKKLAKLYPKAHVVGLDLVPSMLAQAKAKQNFLRKWSLTVADINQLPFADGCFDLIFSNQVLHWAYPLANPLRELNRVLRVDGCLMFSTLGPDTFKEIRRAWGRVDDYAHTNDFMDMHDVGDVLMAERFVEPVVDMEELAIHYRGLDELVAALKLQGVRNINRQRNKGLTGKNSWREFSNNYAHFCAENGKYPLSYEVVYGHAWKGAQRNTELGMETVIPVSQIKVRK